MPSEPPAADRVSYPTAREELPTYTDEDSATETGRGLSFSASLAPRLARNRAVLQRLDGVSAGQLATLDEAETTIGRHTDNALYVPDAGVSRNHARIVQQAGAYFIEDLGSSNGTFVQGEPVRSRRRLTNDDWVQLGPTVTFRFALIDEREEQLMRRLYDSSTRDALTGAYNRKHFEDRLLSEIAFATRHKTDLSLVLFDLDHFKQVNDHHGHPAGDAVLRSVAAVVTQRLRAEDVFARFGGEEFVVLLRATQSKGAAQLAERLRASVATRSIAHDGTLIPVTVSLGCGALSELAAPSGGELVALADRRLYAAKHGGRNRVVAEG